RQVHDPGTLQRLRQPPDLVHQPARDDRGVLGERLRSDVDELEHRGEARVRRTTVRYSRSNLTKRSREPAPSGRLPTSNSSASAWMIAMPRPPSSRSSRWSRAPGTKPWPLSAPSTISRSPSIS